MKRLCLSLALAGVVTLLIVAPVLAAYYVDIDVTESNGTTYTDQPILAEVPIADLVDNHFCLANATDLRVLDGDDNELPFMPSDDYVAFIGNLTASATTGFQVTTGNTPLATFPVITGAGGYVTTEDDADLELSSDDFAIAFEGYLDTSIDNPSPMYADYSYHAGDVDTTANYTHTFTLPLGWLYSGSLLIAIVETTSNGNNHIITPPSGWTTLALSSSPEPTRNLWIGYKISTGTGSNITITTGGNSSYNTYAAYRAVSFPVGQFDGVPEVSVATESWTANPDPPSITPSWGDYPIMTIAGFGAGYDAARNVTSYPSGYGDGDFQQAAGADHYAYIGTANDNVVASSENPGAYTLNATVNAKAFTIAVQGVLPTTPFVSKDSSFYVWPDQGTINAINCNVMPACALSANVTIGEHEVTVWRSSTYWYLDIDGATEDSSLIYAFGFPDTSTNWTMANMPYFNYYQHGVEGGGSVLYESYNGTWDHKKDSAGDQWLAQTFTPTVSHDIESARLYAANYGGSTTNYTLAVRATDGAGRPTGSDLCSVVFNSSILPGAPPVDWVSFDFTTSYSVLAGTKYALVLYDLGDNNQLVQGIECAYNVSYSGGSMAVSFNDGASWSTYANDVLFEEYGSSYNLLVTYQPDSIIEGSVLPNEENPGTYDGTITWGSNPAGVSVDVGTLQSGETYFYYSETDATTPDVIDIEPAAMTGDVDLDKLENNPFNPFVEGMVDGTNGQLTARLIWLGIGWFVFIGAMVFVFLKTKQNIVFTTAVGLWLSVILYGMGIFNYAVIIILGIGFIAAIVHERMPQW